MASAINIAFSATCQLYSIRLNAAVESPLRMVKAGMPTEMGGEPQEAVQAGTQGAVQA
jgi:hypothetical protein